MCTRHNVAFVSSVLAIIACTIFLPSSARADGACCLSCDPEGDCVILSEVECIDRGGEYQGDGVDCSQCPITSNVPNPVMCTVNPADAFNGVVLCPNEPVLLSASEVTIIVRDSCNNPYAGSTVFVELIGPSGYCDGSFSVGGVTDANGEVTLVLDGSGCTHDTFNAAQVKASGVIIRDYLNAKSPDADRDGDVGLGDLVPFSEEFLGFSTSLCHDYDNNGSTGIEDLTLFAEAFLGGKHCP